MTAIVYRDGVLAADTAMWIGNQIIGHMHKIRRLRDGSLVAVSGEGAIIEWFAEWYEGGADRATLPGYPDESWGALVISTNGSVAHIDYKGMPCRVNAPFHVLGAARGFLLGALHDGASAEKAVRLAIEHTDTAAGEVQIERLKMMHQAFPLKSLDELPR